MPLRPRLAEGSHGLPAEAAQLSQAAEHAVALRAVPALLLPAAIAGDSITSSIRRAAEVGWS